MKKLFKIILITLLIIVIAAGVLALWQKDNIASVITSTMYNNDEIASKIENNKKEIEQIIKSYTNETIRDFSHEEEEQIRRGEVSVQEVIDKILKEKTVNANEASTKSSSAESSQTGIDDVINNHISQMYALKATYIGKLGDLERRAKNDYSGLPKEKKGASGQQFIISKYMGEGAALERECDAKVNEVLDSLQKALTSNDKDLKLVKVMRKAYEDEKVLKKSYYLNMYK